MARVNSIEFKGFYRMLNLAKRTVQAFIPSPILASGMIVRERQKLAKIPKAEFVVEPLRPLTRPQIEEAFTDETIAMAWQRGLAQIGEIMPYIDIYGGVCPGERRAIYQMIAWLKPRRVLEIGTHIGASTLAIAQALNSHAESDALLLTGDILDVNNSEQGAFSKLGTISPKEGLCRLGLETRVRFEVKPALELMKSCDDKFDFIFLDGDHSAPAVYQELSAALTLLASKGIVLLHDFYPEGKAIYPGGVIVPGPFVAAQRVSKEFPSVKFIPLGELPWETKQGVRRTSLAVVGR